MAQPLTTDQLLNRLKAAGEPTRLRILALLAVSELNVKDMTHILGQSQPRISRHLKLLCLAELIERIPEGSWVFYRLVETPGEAAFVPYILSMTALDSALFARDLQRLEMFKRQRAAEAQTYFRENAAQWDRIRSLHISESQVESAISKALGAGSFDFLVDLGTGTGRMLELFASRIRAGVGIDVNHNMLSYARTRLQQAGHRHCQVRHGDLFTLPLADSCADVVILHQVLHFLDEPKRALREAARILKTGGRLLIADFAPHELEYLRDDYAHRRLGFDAQQIKRWLGDCDLQMLQHKALIAETEKPHKELTVSIWLAGKQARGRGKNKQSDNKKVKA